MVKTPYIRSSRLVLDHKWHFWLLTFAVLKQLIQSWTKNCILSAIFYAASKKIDVGYPKFYQKWTRKLNLLHPNLVKKQRSKRQKSTTSSSLIENLKYLNAVVSQAVIGRSSVTFFRRPIKNKQFSKFAVNFLGQTSP